MNIEEFEEIVKETCKLNEITYLTSDGPSVPASETIESNGFFDEETLTLAVAKGKSSDLWFLTLIHEYCHMQQFLEDSPFWTESKWDGVDTGNLVHFWLDNKIELNAGEQRMEVFKGTILVEHDCERRVLDLIDKFQLPVDKEIYAKNANAYILFHHAMMSHRKWYTIGREPYNIPEIVAGMPSTLVSDPLTITPEQFNLVEKALLG